MRAHEFILNEKRRKKRKARSVIGPYYGYYYGLGTTTDSGAEGGDGGGVEEGELIPWPKGTVKVDVSDVYDWYKLGQHISNLKGLGKHDFGKGPPQTVMAFGSEPLEHEYIKDLNKIGLKTYDIDENVAEGNNIKILLKVNDEDSTVDVTAMLDGQEVGHVNFDNSQGELIPQDLYVDPEYRGQGIAAAMYDYTKRKGYTILQGEEQSDDAVGFWAKHRPGKKVWEQGVAEGKMAELDMDLEDPEITDRQFEKKYGMTRKEARELFSRTNMWDFPDFRDPSKPLHEQGVTKDSVIFLNDNTVIVGQEHGKSLELSPETSKQVRAIAKKYGAWYEGNGMDRKFTKGIIDEYQGSWDDDLLSPSIKGYPYPFLYVLFSNIEANDTVKGKIGSDPKVTIFNRILDTQPSTNYFPDRTFSSGDLTKFLKSVSQGPYDFVKMSQAPATEKNVQKFFKIGEKLMWPENWEEYPNNAGQLAKRVNDLRDKFLASRKSGVYVVGRSHLIAVKNFANKQDVSESLDRPYSYHWEEGDFGDLNAYAQLSDNTVLDIEFEQINVDKSQWTVGFQRDGQIHKTGKGDEQRVFATVLSAIKEFIENKQPKEVFFSAEKSEVNPESRKRLYDRLVQKYATALGYQASQSETNWGTKYKFLRIRKQGVAEDTQHNSQDLKDVAQWMRTTPDKLNIVVKQEPIEKFINQIREMYGTYDEFPKDEERTNRIVKLLKHGAKPLPMYVEKDDTDLFVMEGRHRMVAFWLAGMKTVPIAYVSVEKQGVAEENLKEFAPGPDFRDDDDRQDMPLLEFAKIIKLFLGSEYTMIDRKTPEQVSVKFNPKDRTSGHNGAVLYSVVRKQNEYPTVNFQLIDYEQGPQVGRGRRAGTAIPKTRTNALKIADIIYNTMGLPQQDSRVEENFPDGKHTAGNYRLQEAGPLKIAGQVAAAHSSANNVVSRFQRGDYAGAGIGALSAIANLKPGLGTAVSLGLDYINDQRDKQNSVANLNKPEVQSGIANDEIKPINPDAAMQENFADGRNPGRKGLAKRMGVPTKASVTRLRQIAKSSSGEKQRMAHWMANMKAGKKK